MRREATSGGRGRGVAIDSAVAAMATPLRIVRMHDIGPQLLEHARQPPRRGQVDFVARRQRNEIEAFGHALKQLARPGGRRAPHDVRARADRSPCTAPGSARRARSARCRCEGRTRWTPDLKVQLLDAVGTPASVEADLGVGVLLHLPQLGELQQHRVGVDQRQGEAGDAVDESARAGRSCAGTPPADAVSRSTALARRPLSCICRAASVRVAVDAIEMVAEIAVRVVLQLARQLADARHPRRPTRGRTCPASAPRAGRTAASDSRDRSRSSGSSVRDER